MDVVKTPYPFKRHERSSLTLFRQFFANIYSGNEYTFAGRNIKINQFYSMWVEIELSMNYQVNGVHDIR